MAKTTSTPTFKVPALADLDPDYAAILTRRTELHTRLGVLRADQRRLEREIAADTSPEFRPGVASLLGDNTASSKASKREQLGATKRELADTEAAVTILERRLADARTKVSAIAAAAVRPEYSRRVACLVRALEAADAARKEVDVFVDELEASDYSLGHLGRVHYGFLGERNEGHIHYFTRQAREAGHV